MDRSEYSNIVKKEGSRAFLFLCCPRGDRRGGRDKYFHNVRQRLPVRAQENPVPFQA